MSKRLIAVSIAAMLAGCTQQASTGTDVPTETPDAATDALGPGGASAAPTPTATGTAEAMRNPIAVGEPDPTAHGKSILTPDGVAALRIGGTTPGSWPKAPTGGDGCRDLASDGLSGGYAIYTGGKIRRLSFTKGSTVRTEEGIGPGSTEKAVRDAFPGLRTEQHKYAPAPAKYLTVPHPGGAPGLRFEIGGDGKVSLMSAGVSPQLEYVEGCG